MKEKVGMGPEREKSMIKILIVEDEISISHLIKLSLKRATPVSAPLTGRRRWRNWKASAMIWSCWM